MARSACILWSFMTKKTKSDASTDNEGNADRALSSDETILWQAITEDVKPLIKTTNKDLTSIESGKTVRRRGVLRSLSPTIHYKPKTAETELSYDPAPRLDRRTEMRLRRGRLSIDACLDLHGMTQGEAHHALVQFLGSVYENGQRTVLVITGKGGTNGRIGVLKEAVPRWLKETMTRRYVRGFAHAAPKDGGEGALYVLVKRKKS